MFPLLFQQIYNYYICTVQVKKNVISISDLQNVLENISMKILT